MRNRFDTEIFPVITLVLKSRGMRWAGNVARIGEDRGTQGVGGEA
jgi:hypothetical protein